MNNVSDKHIISLLISPENRERGFSLLLDTYQERLYWHIRRIVTEHEDANDVIQNTMIKVFRNIDRFKGESKLYTWMYRIATNEAITFMNKKNKHKSISVDDQEIVLNRLASDPYFEGDEIERKLMGAVKTLPERQQLVFNMRYFDCLAYKDIAEILQISQGSLKASFHHAVKKIQHILKNSGYER